MSFKKSIAWVMGIVLLLTVVSGAFLYTNGDQSGGVTSTNEPKYDYVVDNSSYFEKEIYGSARNGTLKTIGAACYDYSRIIVTSQINQEVWSEDYIYDENGLPLSFFVEFPFQINLDISGFKNFELYIEFTPDNSSDKLVEYYLGNSSNITVTADMMPEYGAEECNLYIRVDPDQDDALVIRRCTVNMVPMTYPSGVTDVVALPKNMIHLNNLTDNIGKAVESSDSSFVFTKDRLYVKIPVSISPGFYTFSYFCDDPSVVGYKLNNYSSNTSYYENGEWFYTNVELNAIYIYCSSVSHPEFTVSNVQLERGYERTEYTAYFEPYSIISVSSAITSLPGYGVGSGSLNNYLDLENGTYVQMCELDELNVVGLDEPKVIDVSYYLPPGSGKLDLYGVGALRFLSAYDVDVPSELSYRRLIN